MTIYINVHDYFNVKEYTKLEKISFHRLVMRILMYRDIFFYILKIWHFIASDVYQCILPGFIIHVFVCLFKANVTFKDI